MEEETEEIESEEEVLPADYMRLRTACFKLRSLTHLLEHQADDGAAELDEPDVWYGLGLILREIHGEIIEVARQLEEEKIKVAVKET